MQTTLCKTDREEIKNLLDMLNEYGFESDGVYLENHIAFQRLQAIASQEVHPSGDQSLLSNASSYSWERLISMADFAHRVGGHKMIPVLDALEAEIERRLLALLPQEK